MGAGSGTRVFRGALPCGCWTRRRHRRAAGCTATPGRRESGSFYARCPGRWAPRMVGSRTCQAPGWRAWGLRSGSRLGTGGAAAPFPLDDKAVQWVVHIHVPADPRKGRHRAPAWRVAGVGRSLWHVSTHTSHPETSTELQEGLGQLGAGTWSPAVGCPSQGTGGAGVTHCPCPSQLRARCCGSQARWGHVLTAEPPG